MPPRHGNGEEGFIETVFTCRGNYYDPDFPRQLEKFNNKLHLLLRADQDELIIKKVEPWNSVKVTVNIPKEAVTRLKCLARQDGGHALRSMGIMAIQIEGDRIISLTFADGVAPVTSSSTSNDAAQPQPGPSQIQNDPSNDANLLFQNLFRSTLTANASSDMINPPNVVAPHGGMIPYSLTAQPEARKRNRRSSKQPTGKTPSRRRTKGTSAPATITAPITSEHILDPVITKENQTQEFGSISSTQLQLPAGASSMVRLPENPDSSNVSLAIKVRSSVIQTAHMTETIAVNKRPNVIESTSYLDQPPGGQRLPISSTLPLEPFKYDTVIPSMMSTSIDTSSELSTVTTASSSVTVSAFTTTVSSIPSSVSPDHPQIDLPVHCSPKEIISLDNVLNQHTINYEPMDTGQPIDMTLKAHDRQLDYVKSQTSKSDKQKLYKLMPNILHEQILEDCSTERQLDATTVAVITEQSTTITAECDDGLAQNTVSDSVTSAIGARLFKEEVELPQPFDMSIACKDNMLTEDSSQPKNEHYNEDIEQHEQSESAETTMEVNEILTATNDMPAVHCKKDIESVAAATTFNNEQSHPSVIVSAAEANVLVLTNSNGLSPTGVSEHSTQENPVSRHAHSDAVSNNVDEKAQVRVPLKENAHPEANAIKGHGDLDMADVVQKQVHSTLVDTAELKLNSEIVNSMNERVHSNNCNSVEGVQSDELQHPDMDDTMEEVMHPDTVDTEKKHIHSDLTTEKYLPSAKVDFQNEHVHSDIIEQVHLDLADPVQRLLHPDTVGMVKEHVHCDVPENMELEAHANMKELGGTTPKEQVHPHITPNLNEHVHSNIVENVCEPIHSNIVDSTNELVHSNTLNTVHSDVNDSHTEIADTVKENLCLDLDDEKVHGHPDVVQEQLHPCIAQTVIGQVHDTIVSTTVDRAHSEVDNMKNQICPDVDNAMTEQVYKDSSPTIVKDPTSGSIAAQTEGCALSNSTPLASLEQTVDKSEPGNFPINLPEVADAHEQKADEELKVNNRDDHSLHHHPVVEHEHGENGSSTSTDSGVVPGSPKSDVCPTPPILEHIDESFTKAEVVKTSTQFEVVDKEELQQVPPRTSSCGVAKDRLLTNTSLPNEMHSSSLHAPTSRPSVSLLKTKQTSLTHQSLTAGMFAQSNQMQTGLHNHKKQEHKDPLRVQLVAKGANTINTQRAQNLSAPQTKVVVMPAQSPERTRALQQHYDVSQTNYAHHSVIVNKTKQESLLNEQYFIIGNSLTINPMGVQHTILHQTKVSDSARVIHSKAGSGSMAALNQAHPAVLHPYVINAAQKPADLRKPVYRPHVIHAVDKTLKPTLKMTAKSQSQGSTVTELNTNTPASTIKTTDISAEQKDSNPSNTRQHKVIESKPNDNPTSYSPTSYRPMSASNVLSTLAEHESRNTNACDNTVNSSASVVKKSAILKNDSEENISTKHSTLNQYVESQSSDLLKLPKSPITMNGLPELHNAVEDPSPVDDIKPVVAPVKMHTSESVEDCSESPPQERRSNRARHSSRDLSSPETTVKVPNKKRTNKRETSESSVEHENPVADLEDSMTDADSRLVASEVLAAQKNKNAKVKRTAVMAGIGENGAVERLPNKRTTRSQGCREYQALPTIYRDRRAPRTKK